MLNAGEEECRPPKAEQRSSTGTEAQQEQRCSHPSCKGQSRQHPHVGRSVGRCGEHRAAGSELRELHLCVCEEWSPQLAGMRACRWTRSCGSPQSWWGRGRICA